MTEWIPIPVGLPDEGVEVLLIDKNGNQSVGYYQQGYLMPGKGEIDSHGNEIIAEYKSYDDPWHVGAGIKTYDDVWIDTPVAWQPLPKPYKK